MPNNALIPLGVTGVDFANSLGRGLTIGNALLDAPVDRRLKSAQADYYEQRALDPNMGAEVYGTPIYGQDPNTGETVLGAIGRDGTFRRLDTGGLSIAPGIKTVDMGTGTAVLNSRTGQPVMSAGQGGIVPKDVSGESQQREYGQQAGAAQVQLPKVEYFAKQMISDIDRLTTDPRLQNVTGWEANLPTFNPANVDVEEKIKQLGGGTFLQAFEGLKGGGQITNVEGEKATVAINRLQNMRQSDPGYLVALQDAKQAVWDLQNVARAKAGQPPLPAPWQQGQGQPQPAPQAGPVTVSPPGQQQAAGPNLPQGMTLEGVRGVIQQLKSQGVPEEQIKAWMREAGIDPDQ